MLAQRLGTLPISTAAGPIPAPPSPLLSAGTAGLGWGSITVRKTLPRISTKILSTLQGPWSPPKSKASDLSPCTWAHRGQAPPFPGDNTTPPLASVPGGFQADLGSARLRGGAGGRHSPLTIPHSSGRAGRPLPSDSLGRVQPSNSAQQGSLGGRTRCSPPTASLRRR